MAKLVSKAVEEVITLPILGIIKERVEIVIAEPEPNKISVTINNTFFLPEHLYFFLYYSSSISRDFLLNFYHDVFPFDILVI